jgi:topoisomerase-like DNA binding C4 zinc finger protein
MRNPQLDQFIHALQTKVVLTLILCAVGGFLLAVALKWFENWLVRTIRSARARKESKNSQPQPTDGASLPHCPICNSLMVKRTARRGANAGSSFWGCVNYPKCNGTRVI